MSFALSKWEERFMSMARLVATWSRDLVCPSRLDRLHDLRDPPALFAMRGLDRAERHRAGCVTDPDTGLRLALERPL